METDYKKMSIEELLSAKESMNKEKNNLYDMIACNNILYNSLLDELKARNSVIYSNYKNKYLMIQNNKNDDICCIYVTDIDPLEEENYAVLKGYSVTKRNNIFRIGKCGYCGHTEYIGPNNGETITVFDTKEEFLSKVREIAESSINELDNICEQLSTKNNV